MIQGFSEQTKPLTPYENDVILPLVLQGFHAKIGKQGYKVDNARLRKIINHIRINGMVIGLIATSDGYYIAETRKELEVYLKSLEGREGAIHAVRKSLERQLQLYE